MNRKQFVNKLGAAALLTSLGVTAESCTYDQEASQDPDVPTPALATFSVTSGVFTALATDDGWLLHPSENILLVNIGGVNSAYSSSCPHSGCTREWGYSNSTFTCNCHFSRFQADGSLISGPAGRGLTKLTVEQDGDTVSIFS